jgi:ABC-2 type transport system permease protein
VSRSRQHLLAIGLLGRRAAAQTLRRPPLVAPIIILPTVILVAFSGGGASAVALPSFPHVPSFFDFELPGILTLSATLAGMSGAIAMGVDMEGSFVDRVLAAPVWRGSFVIGRLMGIGLLGAVGAVWFIALGLVFGHWPSAGVVGLLAMIALAGVTGACVGSLIGSVAIRSRQASVVQGVFPLALFSLLLSSAFFPQRLLLEPTKAIASVNPLTAVANAMRHAWVGDLTLGRFGGAVGAMAAVAALGALLSARALEALRR